MKNRTLKNIIGTGCLLSALLLVAFFPNKEKEVSHISEKGRKAYSVHLLHNQENIPVICFTEQDTASQKKYFSFAIYDKKSKDFGEKINIPIPESAALHIEGMPKIAFKKNGNLIAAYQTKAKSEVNKHASNIYYTFSQDDGKTWSVPAMVHQNQTPDQGRSFFDITTLKNGEVGITWLGESNKSGRPVKFAQTNSKNEFVGEIDVDSVACQCCRTAIFSDEKGNISIVYRDILENNIRDISVVTSSDNGKTFSAPTCFSGDSWNINGCPHNGPDVVSNGKNIYATWFTGAKERGIYYASLDIKNKKAQKTLISSSGKNIQLSLLDSEKQVLVYNEDKVENEIYYSAIYAQIKPTNQVIPITPPNAFAKFSVVINSDKESFIVAWIENISGEELVRWKRVSTSI
ncbi:MAG: glycoside hydrolase [Thermoflexibacter sp.]|nr:glycoside hydrolase [Thermoflexibacter sp.]